MPAEVRDRLARVLHGADVRRGRGDVERRARRLGYREQADGYGCDRDERQRAQLHGRARMREHERPSNSSSAPQSGQRPPMTCCSVDVKLPF